MVLRLTVLLRELETFLHYVMIVVFLFTYICGITEGE